MSEKILVVDDDIDTLRLVGLMLQRQGYQISAASNGHQALQMAKGERPDLILLDVMMPDMDGYEVTRRLRADLVTNSIPIIMFTAKSQVDDKVTGFEAGADDYLTKPTQPRELFAHVKAVLARGVKTRTNTTQPTVTVMGEKGHVVGILAAKGGLGVSTLALNLAVSLNSRTQKDILLAEFRPGQGSIGLDLGFNRPEGLSRLLQKKPKDLTPEDVQTELITHSSGIRLLLSTFQPADGRYITGGEVFEAIANIASHQASYMLIDLGVGFSPIVDKILGICDELIIVVEPVPSTILRTRLLIEELITRGFGEGRITAILYNRNRSELQLSLAQVQEQLHFSISIVFTPAPELTFQASRSNMPLVLMHPDNLTSQQFSKLAEMIIKHVHNRP